ncbi:peptide chain release factor N(5)-glutamine methyltransferase [Allorhizobium sp. BGMRC 0089]|uniref:peptide chain release factor N(5)-glutamine methyltransferase n=1 Tax=Allorhizobium sonneratiae TaxID=2934936 RepID=UPI0020346AE8|nr:peptide chain release factor N(5)-glutamine methyltransferase [Allorhizobium sonneratiae]MCM2293550.1 peptide chain release factor N(5)-glutamine methyltransferase [Allorhizobium sonneratiae]
MSEAHPITVAMILAAARQELAAAGIADARGDARHLVAGILGWSLGDLVLKDQEVLSPEALERIERALVRRHAREPVYRILGSRNFYGLELALSTETLEPRPDTELVVDALLPYLKRQAAEKGTVRVLDLGTGTGAIALALLNECAEARALATDISEGALQTARENARRNGLSDRFATCHSDWFDAIEGRFDMIVSNPPYIERGMIGELEPEVRLHDPARALDGGVDGLDCYRIIAAGAEACLEPDGYVGLEIGFDQKQTVTDLFEDAGFKRIEALRDHAGQDRVLIFKTKQA